jgi:hypothetical protein
VAATTAAAPTPEEGIMAIKNLAGKSREIGTAPYEVWALGDWTWHVLKKYQAQDDKPFARWFCDVYGFAHEAGDTYVDDIKGAGARLVWIDPAYKAAQELQGVQVPGTAATQPEGWRNWTR